MLYINCNILLLTGIGTNTNATTVKAFTILVKIFIYIPLIYVFVLLAIMARRYIMLKGGEGSSQTSLTENPVSVDEDEP